VVHGFLFVVMKLKNLRIIVISILF